MLISEGNLPSSGADRGERAIDQWIPSHGLSAAEKIRLASNITAMLAPDSRRDIPDTLWHYTSGEGLISILRGGKLFASHVSGLNDRLEHLHLSKVIISVIDERLRLALPDVRDLLLALKKGAVARDVTGEGAFVTCFSTADDDLGQWRGYGGGECGYAIGFDGPRLFAKAATRPLRAFLRMRYDAGEHTRLANLFVDQCIEALQSGESLSDAYWAEYSDFVSWVMALSKHPKFQSEQEYRFLTRLMTEDLEKLQFRQKRTLLSRYLEVDFTVDGKLPIRSICIGPGPAQDVTLVGVRDLLKQTGYADVQIQKSQVPYRIP